ncbi:uncharacterized protein [Nicotiana sylvestris]|uniref:Uncharacterized protein LOC104215665 isoform X1 n=1 Tax=Nicotiana sylvestris TaxID=4096 RepID=A0A1U7VN71_NICSY|nr:PREDICTED: uncharacterized protein LOC104215665 isoform X1 [Nicotiana sylvestris]XP_009763812.1 PREDICTED: uncharacterized protein LOC104215665 isoform X1 [Nicotiana sylvestris]XP_009763813.1 PREDICTED: uncharacterized protein LOC104215665 isoform X1 [Nicotiana sylvestris]XP_009763814.1 PREDICTED: uncharacterized protein LOC104215665 isoform X1 [Nicotiana sylvestris]
MSRLEKIIDSICPRKKGSVNALKKGVKIKQRRREIYREKSADRRELNLMQRRMVYLHSTTYNPIGNSTEVPTSSQFSKERIENTVGVRGDLSSLLETTNVQSLDASVISDNGRDIGSRSCAFEVGSTSGTCTEQYNITSHTTTRKDEIKQYQSARWISPPEATWCLFGFPISEISPAIYHLQVQLTSFAHLKANTIQEKFLNIQHQYQHIARQIKRASTKHKGRNEN